MEVLINNLQEKIEADDKLKELINNVIEKTAERENVVEGEVSVALVDNEYIKELNSKYRDLNEATDVLSFPLDEEILGDIIISLERAKEQASDYGHSLHREVGFLIVHGMLHLLGYDHQRKEEKVRMREKEEKILDQLSLNR
jgi:probable rRNA maturation factor